MLSPSFNMAPASAKRAPFRRKLTSLKLTIYNCPHLDIFLTAEIDQ
jgi:hypothetical protein